MMKRNSLCGRNEYVVIKRRDMTANGSIDTEENGMKMMVRRSARGRAE